VEKEILISKKKKKNCAVILEILCGSVSLSHNNSFSASFTYSWCKGKDKDEIGMRWMSNGV
jgi:hypothetical protein